MQKVRSIFYWITDNISYKVKANYPVRSKRYEGQWFDRNEIDEDTDLLPLNERVAINVLRNRSAVCDGYSRLFKTLCDYAGIRSEIITGYARANRGISGNKFLSNHQWNAVLIEGKWHLLDVTWASGFINMSGTTFIKQLDESYFLTDPHLFLQDHYPEDLQWTLIPKPPAISEFRLAPFRQSSYRKLRVVSFQPSKGIIEAAIGDTVRFELEVNEEIKNMFVSANPALDMYLQHFLGIKIPHAKLLSRQKAIFSYVIPTHAPEWLYLLINQEVVLQYQLKVVPSSRVTLQQ